MNITSLTQHALTQHAARALGILGAYWASLVSQGDLPLWSDIDPGQIQDALDHAFLAERFGHCHARIRVAGGAVEEMAGKPCKGLPLSLLIRANDRAVFNEAVIACCIGGYPIEIALTSEEDVATSKVSARLVLYPLRDTTGRVTQFLGGLAPVGDAIARLGSFGVVEVMAHRTQTRRSLLRLIVDNT
ncbi:MAG: PAS domain-containing protein [Marivita sp.]|uniref:PAS domain-containing protein n=1 Tax=Marivita sp. TaxID=2003365 RepID=UPI001B248933|nr:PAS domain-containing protein [Marivita sp.]MBO6883936.1 PAS domain-containing protein [Marivita sp.]